MIGQTISRYRLEDKLGEGGVGVVYRALDLRLGRTVALKMLRPELASNTAVAKRFATEAHAASRLNHPAIATLFDFEVHEGLGFLVYEYIPGRTLRDVLRERTLTLEELLQIFISIADGVAAAHEAGVIHRDLKPENVMVNDDGRVKILDFGLAKVSALETRQSTIPTAATTPGLLIGTVSYMSPEQLEGESPDHRTDVFAIGTMLYEAVTGTHPFEGKSPGSTIGNILKEEPKRTSGFAIRIPDDLERVIRKCVRKRKEERYQSMRDLLVDLQEVRRGLAAGDHAVVGDRPSDSDFLLSPGTARNLFLVAQCGYLALYGTVMYYGEAVSRLLPGLSSLVLVFVSAMCGIAIRLYLLSSVGFRHPAAAQQFRRLFPAVLVLDVFWAASPLLLWPRMGFLALACVAVMVYLPFSQRTLMFSAYTATRPSVIGLNRR